MPGARTGCAWLVWIHFARRYRRLRGADPAVNNVGAARRFHAQPIVMSWKPRGIIKCFMRDRGAFGRRDRVAELSVDERLLPRRM